MYLVNSKLEITPWIDIHADSIDSKSDERKYLVPISIVSML